MGYGDTTPDVEIVGETVQVLKEIKSVLNPKAVILQAQGTLDEVTWHLNVDVPTDSMSCCNNPITRQETFDVGKIIGRQLHGAEEYVFFICTTGGEFQTLLEQIQADGDIVRTFIADAVGSVLAERMADFMERKLQETLGTMRWHHTNRFSPGYCGWHVSQQKKLFGLFNTEAPCGVELSESCLMMPIKSVSGVIGVGEKVRHRDYSCGLCNQKRCYKTLSNV